MSEVKIIELLHLRFLIGQMTDREWYWSDINRPDYRDPSQLFDLGNKISETYKELTKAGGVCPELRKFGIFGYYKDSLPFHAVLTDLVPISSRGKRDYIESVDGWFYLWNTHESWSRKKFGPRNPDYALRDIVDDLDMFICRELNTCDKFEMDIEDFWELERYIKLVLFPKISYRHIPSVYMYRAIDRLVKDMEIFLKGTRYAIEENRYYSKVEHSLIELYSTKQLNSETLKSLLANYNRVVHWAHIYRNAYYLWDFRDCHNKLII